MLRLTTRLDVHYLAKNIIYLVRVSVTIERLLIVVTESILTVLHEE